MTDGLLIRKKWVELIVLGIKTQEVRSWEPPQDKIAVPIYVLCEGHVWAKIRINSFGFDTRTETYRWDFVILETYPVGRKYFHPNGAQRWVKNVRLKNDVS